MSTMDDQISELMSAVNSGSRPTKPPTKARPYPESGRYYLIKQDLDDTEDTFKKIAERHGVTIKEVRKIALAEGIDRPQPQNRTTYNKEARVELLDQAFEKTASLLQDVDSPREMQQLTSALSTLIDKRRLEDGEATERTEHGLTDGARESLALKLADVTDRRAKSFVVLQQLQALQTPATDLPIIPPLPGDPGDDADTIDAEYDDLTGTDA